MATKKHELPFQLNEWLTKWGKTELIPKNILKNNIRLFLQVSIDVEALNNAEAKSKEAAKAAEASAAALAKEVAQDAVEKKPPHKVS